MMRRGPERIMAIEDSYRQNGRFGHFITNSNKMCNWHNSLPEVTSAAVGLVVA
jgi:hypothetical protein